MPYGLASRVSSIKRLVVAWEHHREQGDNREHVSYPNFRDWRERNRVFERLAAYRDIRVNYTTEEGTERLAGARVTADFFPTLRVDAHLGRTFEAADDRPGAPPVVVLDHGFWQRRLAGKTDVLGSTITIGGVDAQVVGVLPPGFEPPLDLDAAELWLPAAGDRGYFEQRSLHPLIGLGRLRDGVDLEQAQREMDTIAAELEQEYPASNEGKGASLVTLHQQTTGAARPLLLLLFGVTLAVLLIACANLAGLLLARGTARHREYSIRQALGAGRARLARQFLTESALLGLLGGAVGVILAPALVEGLRSRLDSWEIPRLDEVALDARAVAFAAGLSLLCSLLAALVPALRAGGGGRLTDSLGAGGGAFAGARGSRARQALVVTEIALAMILLMATGLLVRSFTHLSQVDPGVDTASVLTLRVSFSERRHGGADQLADVHARALERLRGLPGVEAAGAATTMPLTSGSWVTDFWISSRSDPDADEGVPFRYYLATPEYFSTLGIPLLRGRLLADTDRRPLPGAVVINQTMARRFWPGGEPLGEEIVLGLSFGQEGEPRSYKIVGVVGDVRHGGLDVDVMPQIYVSYRQQTNDDAMHYALRTSVVPLALLDEVRAEIAAVDRDAPIFSISTLGEMRRRATGSRRVAASMIGACSALALVLAAVGLFGLFGLLSYVVRRRSKELGIRLALGAQRTQVLRLVMRQGLGLTLIGLALGLVGSLALSRFLDSLLFEIAATDTTTRIVVSVVLLAIAGLVSYQPARSAARADPMTTVRHDRCTLRRGLIAA